MSRPTCVRKKRPDESVLDFAHYLLDFYAPGVKRRILFTQGDSEYRVHADGSKTITWRIPHKLDALLHEIAHYRLKHHHWECSTADDLIMEAEAWLWAERKARVHGITFEYALNEQAYAGYRWRGRKRGPVKIDWRHRNGRD